MLPHSGTIETSVLQEDVNDMIGDVAEMERLIESYLSFARGEGAEEPQEIDVAALLDDVAAAALRSGIRRCDVSCDPGLTLEARPDALRRMLANLVENARRLDAGVWLTGYGEDRNIVLEVDDDGPGIPADRREEVFRAFTSGKRGGTGLGLTIVRDIVRAHGGDIKLDASVKGGLNVRITLPR